MATISCNQLTIFFTIFATLSVLIVQVNCLSCTEETVFGNTRIIQCPQMLDSSDEIYCCGTKEYRHCCDKAEYERTLAVMAPAGIGLLISFILAIIIIVIVSCFCCRCCMGYKYRQNRGRVLLTPAAVQQTATMQPTYAPPPPHTYPQHQMGAPAPYPNVPVGAPAQVGPPPPGFAPPPAYPSAPPQGYPPVDNQYPSAGAQYPPPGVQYPPPGAQYPPAGNQYPPAYSAS